MAALLSGCSLLHPHRAELHEADSIIEEHPDSAFRIVDNINLRELSGDADIALYGLLRTEAAYRCYQPAHSDSLIERSIEYFSRKRDIPRLVRSYFYKGITTYDNNHNKALECIKKAETLAKKLNDNTLNHKIYEGLVMINDRAKCYEMMLKYAKLSLECSQRDSRPYWMAYSLMHVANSFMCLDKDDSARIYADKIFPLLK